MIVIIIDMMITMLLIINYDMTSTCICFNCQVLQVILICANHYPHIIHLIHHTVLVFACMMDDVYNTIQINIIIINILNIIIIILNIIIFIIFHLFPYLISSLLLQDGDTALIVASYYGHHEVARTLLEAGAYINAQCNVRN